MDDETKIAIAVIVLIALVLGSILVRANLDHEYRMAELAIDCPAATEEE